ncbi:MAG TPA: hypothetical protein ENF41_01795 [Candidatus Bathyarchaeota archaeon]|nr:hypothetical protein [Candidatus Bathyarchaeota archaeon]
MRERYNGLGAGFAGYGIYPNHRDEYCLHVMAEDEKIMIQVSEYLDSRFQIVKDEKIPTGKAIRDTEPPVFRRFFVNVPEWILSSLIKRMSPDDYVLRKIRRLHVRFPKAYVFSSGKNIGVFKGIGYPEEVAQFFRIENYSGYMWIGHGRYPTNTPGWWGGAHPFSILGWSVAHNGEISSYGTNKRFVESAGYVCYMLTDTEVITYLLDLLVRRHRLSLKTAVKVLTPPRWDEYEKTDNGRNLRILRVVYRSAVLSGPFAVVGGYSMDGEIGLFAFNDRLKLRPMVVGEGNDGIIAVASEEHAVIELLSKMKRIWHPKGGELVEVKMESERHGE